MARLKKEAEKVENSCIFCKIANKEIESKLTYEDNNVVAFNDINPQAPTHILVIPKKHIEHLADINLELSNAIFSAINKLTDNLPGFRVVMNFGAEAGQAVVHLHFHILSGRKMDWPPG